MYVCMCVCVCEYKKTVQWLIIPVRYNNNGKNLNAKVE